MANGQPKAKIFRALYGRGVSLLRLDAAEWQDIQATRQQGRRFSLNFPHGVADQVKAKTLVLISAKGAKHLMAGMIGSIGATATFDSRVVFDFVHELTTASLDAALSALTASSLKAGIAKLKKGRSRLSTLTPKLGEQLVLSLANSATDAKVLAAILAQLSPPKRFDNARAMQWDAVKTALKAFGMNEASFVSLPGGDTALGSTRILEDAVIEHDARSIPGWTLTGSEVTGVATFNNGDEQLEVITANKRPLEELFGVDLIYLNKSRGSLVMVQYKMMERQEPRIVTLKLPDGSARKVGKTDYLVRINDQFDDEIKRMKKFDRDLDTQGPYRLNPGAFYVKLVRKNAEAGSSGITMSLPHLTGLVDAGKAKGPKGGLRVSYDELDGHYLRSEAFVELVRSGYIGSRGATTAHLMELVQAGLTGGRAVVAAIQTHMVSIPD